MKVDPRAGIPPDGKDVLQECTWPAWMDGGWNSHGLAKVLSTTCRFPVRPNYSKIHKTKLHMDARTRYAFVATDKKQPAIRIDRFLNINPMRRLKNVLATGRYSDFARERVILTISGI